MGERTKGVPGRCPQEQSCESKAREQKTNIREQGAVQTAAGRMAGAEDSTGVCLSDCGGFNALLGSTLCPQRRLLSSSETTSWKGGNYPL